MVDRESKGIVKA